MKAKYFNRSPVLDTGWIDVLPVDELVKAQADKGYQDYLARFEQQREMYPELHEDWGPPLDHQSYCKQKQISWEQGGIVLLPHNKNGVAHYEI